MTSRYTTVSIPKELAQKARKRIEETGFNNLSDYVTFILREIVSTSKDDDKEVIKQKLKALGYL
jgi:Arc/MetJ-type ribon-helix-helix transcriptional regulator